MEEYYEEEEPTFSPERVLTFVSWVILILGIIGTIFAFSELCFVTAYDYDFYGDGLSKTTEFSPLGLIACFYIMFLTATCWGGLQLSVKMSRTLTAIKNK